jgi:hypothetical protein
VVVHIDEPTDLVVRGLPAGAYGASQTTERDFAAERGPLSVGEDGIAKLRAPERGILTIFAQVPPTHPEQR